MPYPLGADTLLEGGPGSCGDRHALVVDAGTCRLYETWDTRPSGAAWLAGSGATWDLGSNALRPAGWTSARRHGGVDLVRDVGHSMLLLSSLDRQPDYGAVGQSRHA